MICKTVTSRFRITKACWQRHRRLAWVLFFCVCFLIATLPLHGYAFFSFNFPFASSGSLLYFAILIIFFVLFILCRCYGAGIRISTYR